MTAHKNQREAKWPPIGRVPCVRCGHLYGYHARHAGPCATKGCDCKAFLHRAQGDGTLVVTPGQLHDGYRRNPHVRLASNSIESERCDYQVIARYEDGNYLVRVPEEEQQWQSRSNPLSHAAVTHKSQAGNRPI